MKRSTIKTAVLLAVILATMLFSSSAFAKSYQQPSGAPPYGLAIQSDAAGTKLYGVVSVEEYNFVPDSTTKFYNARIVLRLRSGNDIVTLYGEIKDTLMDIYTPAIIQNLITEVMKPKIIEAFFCSDCSTCNCSLSVVLKGVTDFSSTDLISNLLTGYSRYVVADVTIAVK